MKLPSFFIGIAITSKNIYSKYVFFGYYFLQLGWSLVADDLNAADFHYMKAWPNEDTLWQTITL